MIVGDPIDSEDSCEFMSEKNIEKEESIDVIPYPVRALNMTQNTGNHQRKAWV